MSRLLDRVKGLFGISFGGPGAPSYQTAIEWNLGVLESGETWTLPDPYATSATVALAISTIAGDSASIEWESYSSNGDDTEVEEHPVQDLLVSPAPYMTCRQLVVGTYVSRLLWGEAFWYYKMATLGRLDAARANRRRTGAIELLDPRAITCKTNKSGELEWFFRTNGQDVALDSDYLTQFKRFIPYNSVRGLSQLAASLLAAPDRPQAQRVARDVRPASPNSAVIPAGVLSRLPGPGC